MIWQICKLPIENCVLELSSWVKASINVFVPFHKYQVKPQFSPWFACSATIGPKNHDIIVLITIDDSLLYLIIIIVNMSLRTSLCSVTEGGTLQPLISFVHWWRCNSVLTVMLIGFQCSDSLGATGGDLGGSLERSIEQN